MGVCVAVFGFNDGSRTTTRVFLARGVQQLVLDHPNRCSMVMMPHDLPPWHTGYQQTQRWVRAGVFETMVHNLRMLIRVAASGF